MAINFKSMENLTQELFSHLKQMEMNNEEEMRNFKIEQGELMKNIVINSNDYGSLERQTLIYKEELKKRDSKKKEISMQMDMLLREYNEKLRRMVLGEDIFNVPTTDTVDEPIEKTPIESETEKILREMEEGTVNVDPVEETEESGKIPEGTEELDKWIEQIKNQIDQ